MLKKFNKIPISSKFYYKLIQDGQFDFFTKLKWASNKNYKKKDYISKSYSNFLKNNIRTDAFNSWFLKKVNLSKNFNLVSKKYKYSSSKHKTLLRKRKAIIYISFFNTNIFINVHCSLTHKALFKISAGSLGFNGKKCCSFQSVEVLSNYLIYNLSLFNYRCIHLYYSGLMFNKLLKKFFFKLFKFNFKVYCIVFNNSLAHNGCRLAKLRRK